MASASTETGLALDTFAALVGIHPLHFNQVFLDKVSGCGDVWLSYDWQKPSEISRESVAQAIRQAEDDLEEFLGFSTYPKWYEDIKIPIHGQGQLVGYSFWYPSEVKIPVVLPKGHYIEGGQKKLTFIGAANITYLDDDNDGYFEYGLIQIASDVASDEIVVYYPLSSVGVTGLHPDYQQIRPIKVTADGTTVEIKINRYDLVKRDELEKFVPQAINGLDDDLFLDTVHVYRLYNDASVQTELHGVCRHCGSNSCGSCEFQTYTACMKATDHKSSIVDITPATFMDGTFTHTTCVAPIYDSRIWFKAGWTGPNIWDQAIAYLALSRMPLGLCACPTAKAKIDYWAKDTAQSTRDGGTFKIPKFAEECPWGYSRGAMFAYSLAAKHKIAQGRH